MKPTDYVNKVIAMLVLSLLFSVSAARADGVLVTEPVSPGSDVMEKALPGAGWIFSFSTDGRTLNAYFISGRTATGTFASCPIMSNFFLFTVKRDGASIYQYSANRYDLIFAGNNACGLHWRLIGSPVADPGQYEFRVEEPAVGAPSVGNFTVAACRYQTPLYQTYSSAVNDYFYTVLASDRDIAINTYGYVNAGIAARVESTLIGGSLPFKRFYKYLPQTDHFYTTSATEEAFVRDNGWVFERVEGYIYPTQKPGTVPFYRVSRWYPSTGDLEHFYTTSASTRASYLAQGWTADPLAGYVCP